MSMKPHSASPDVIIPGEVFASALRTAILERMDALDLESIKLLNAKDAARLFNISPATLRKGRIDCIDFGERNMRWSIKDLKAAVESRRVKAWKR